MRGTGIYHPLFATHPRNGLTTSMTDRVEIYKPTGVRSNWVPGEGISEEGYELIYRGQGRVQPNLDWRARDRNMASELTGTQTIRVQVPVRGNELRSDKECPLIAKDYLVVMIDTPANENGWLKGTPIIVRNATQATQKWIRTMIADTGTRSTDG